MNSKELRGLSEADLTKELLDLRRDQFKVRMQTATQQLTTTHRIKAVRRSIARVKTIQTERAVAK